MPDSAALRSVLESRLGAAPTGPAGPSAVDTGPGSNGAVARCSVAAQQLAGTGVGFPQYAAFLHYAGIPGEVYVFTRGESHRRLALQLGATWAGAPGDSPPAAADRAVIFAPSGWIVPMALQAVRPGGTVAINAVHMSDIPSFPYALIYGERTLRSVANVTRSDAEEFMRLAGELGIRTEVARYAFSQADDALLALKSGEIDGAEVLDVEASG